MNHAGSLLKITYTGEPVRADHERITEDMFVPNVGHDGPLHADDLPGQVVAGLFNLAVSERRTHHSRRPHR
jgi:hypothetical protein